MKLYLDLLDRIIGTGERKENRTGIDTMVIPPVQIQHDMGKGFPLLTTKKMAKKTMAVELEGFIKGVTSKAWFQERGCRIWNEWANPISVTKRVEYLGKPEGEDPDAFRKRVQLGTDDLGPIYGAQWRNYNFQGCDQFDNIVQKLKTNPNDRRMICMAWNPLAVDEQALPACHLGFIIQHINGKLHLAWWQRSVDTFLGLPFNLASYALLLHLICLETGMKEGTVTGQLVDVHIYENHREQVLEQLGRTPYSLPRVSTPNFTSIYDWKASDTEFIGYQHHPPIKAEVAV